MEMQKLFIILFLEWSDWHMKRDQIYEVVEVRRMKVEIQNSCWFRQLIYERVCSLAGDVFRYRGDSLII